MPTTDLQEVNRFIINQLKSSSLLATFVGKNPVSNKLQFYRGRAPQSATFPYIEFKMIANPPRTERGRKIFGRPKYQIKIVQKGDAEDCYESKAYPAYAELAFLFRKNQESQTDAIVGCHIYNELTYYDVAEGGEQVAHLVYLLNFFVDPIE